MARKLTFRQLVVLILALWNDLSQKEIAGRVRMTSSRISQLLTRERKKEIDDDLYELLLSVVAHRRAEVSLVRACLEALDALDGESGSTEEEQTAIEEEILEGSRLMRRYLSAAALRSRLPRPAEGYPHAIDLPVCRHWAEEQLAKLARVPRRSRLAVVRLGREYQHWGLVERCCEESVREASRSLREAASWARLALAISRLVTGPEDWRQRLQGYALAHWANVLRVRGDLPAADACLEEARQLWESGSDPIEVLDPGRLFDLEGSLRRDQRRFDEALNCFDQAIPVSRFPARPEPAVQVMSRMGCHTDPSRSPHPSAASAGSARWGPRYILRRCLPSRSRAGRAGPREGSGGMRRQPQQGACGAWAGSPARRRPRASTVRAGRARQG